MAICITCNKEKRQDDMFFNSTLRTYRNVCRACRNDEVVRNNLKRAKTEGKRTIIHLRNVLRKMVEALTERDSKQLRLWADVAKLEIGVQKNKMGVGTNHDN